METLRPAARVVWLLAAVMLVFALGGCNNRSEATRSEPAATPVSTGIKAEDAATYVGSNVCKTCHEGVYRGWQTTFHAQKFQVANSDYIIGDFEKKNTLQAGGHTTSMTRKGDDYFVTTVGPDGKEGTYKVKYVLGSIWKQLYITEFPNGQLQVLPVQWKVLPEEWADYYGLAEQKPGDGQFWSDKARMFQYECMGCHTTNSKVTYDEKTDTYTTTWKQMGVGCEACHGPGSKHVAADLSHKFDTIVNPPRIPDPRRAGMVCGACHDVGTSENGKYAYPVDYRPGQVLKFHVEKSARTFPDGSPRTHHQQYHDWQQSGHARAGVMCWDCHSPHVRGKFNRYQLKLPGSLLCLTCHTDVARTGAHSIHSTNNCIGCHMPNTIKSATPGDLRSHRMTVIRPEWTVEAGGDVNKQPNSCNLCHYHRNYSPERLVHMLKAVEKPAACWNCHKDESPEDYDPTE